MADESVIKKDEQEAPESEIILPEKNRRKKIFNLIGTIFLALIVIGIIGWIRFSTNQKAVEMQEKAQRSTLAKQAANEKENAEETKKQAQIDEALDKFLVSNYKGWKLQGKNLKNDSANNNIIYDVDLVEGSRDKIIPVVVEKFQKENDDEYWIAHQLPPAELLEMEFKSLSEKVAESENDKNSVTDKDSDDSN